MIRRALAAILSLSLVLLSPGLAPFEALAQVRNTGTAPVGPVGEPLILPTLEAAGFEAVPVASELGSGAVLSVDALRSLAGQAEAGRAAAAAMRGRSVSVSRRVAAARAAAQASRSEARWSTGAARFDRSTVRRAQAVSIPDRPELVEGRPIQAPALRSAPEVVSSEFRVLEKTGTSWKIDGRAVGTVGFGSFKYVLAHPERRDRVVKVFVGPRGAGTSLAEMRLELRKAEALEKLGAGPKVLGSGTAWLKSAQGEVRVAYLVQERVEGLDLSAAGVSKKSDALASLEAKLERAGVAISDRTKLEQNVMFGRTASEPQAQAWIVDADIVELGGKAVRAPHPAFGHPLPASRGEGKTSLGVFAVGAAGLALSIGWALSGRVEGLLAWLAGYGAYRALSGRLGSRPALAIGLAAAAAAFSLLAFWSPVQATSAGFAAMGMVGAPGDPAEGWRKRFAELFDGGKEPAAATVFFVNPGVNERARSIVREGLERGFVIRLPAGRANPDAEHFLYALPPAADDRDVSGATSILREGARLHGQGRTLEALERFELAVDRFHRHSEANDSDGYTDGYLLALSLERNAAAEVLRGQIRALDQDARETPEIVAAWRFLESARFSLDDKPKAGSAEEAAAVAAVAKLVRDALPRGDEDWARRVEKGLDFLLQTISPDPRAGPLPAAERRPEPADPRIFRLSDSEFPNLTKYARNVTLQAAEGKLKPVIGRKAEIQQLVMRLVRWTKPNPVLVGEPGIGKSAIVEGLAQAIARGEIPELEGKILLELDLGGLVAGTTYRGDLEARVKGVLDEARKLEGRAKLFIDELHMVLGLGDSIGGADVANLIKPALSRGEISVIGATTLRDFRQIEKDPALERRFNPVYVDPPSEAEAVSILKGLAPKLAEHHGVSLADEAVEAAVKLSARYLPGRQLPDIAIDVLDDAASLVKVVERGTAVELRHVEAIVSRRSRVPVEKMGEGEREKIARLEERLNAEVINQKDATKVVSNAVSRNRTGWGDPKRPLGSFMFLGPTGVGKTELAKALARNLFGTEEALIRFDMSEYMEKHEASKLIGAPPGYVGYEEPGLLTEAVRQRPYAVLLLDEIEKAHPNVRNVLLQLLDDGRLTDNHGRVVNFKNVVVIMTSNIGGAVVKDTEGMGFGARTKTSDEVKSGYKEELQASVPPEFLNRVDEHVVFNRLQRADIEKILELQLAPVLALAAEKGVRLELTEAAKAFLVREGYDPAYGARPLKRAITRELRDALAKEELAGRITRGDTVAVDAAEDGKRLVFTRKTPGGGGTAALGALMAPALMTGVQAFLGVPDPVVSIAVPVVMASAAGLAYMVARRLFLPKGGSAERAPLRSFLPRIGWVVLAAIVLDWAAKLYAVEHLSSVILHPLPGLALLRVVVTPIIIAALLMIRRLLVAPGRLKSRYAGVEPARKGHDLALGAVIGGLLANSIEGLTRREVVDFIPLGDFSGNLADLLIFFGASYWLQSLTFFLLAAKADERSEPVTYPSWMFFLAPGLVVLGSQLALGYLAGVVALQYLHFFAAVFAVTMPLTAAYLHRHVRSFNRSFHAGRQTTVYLELEKEPFGAWWRFRRRLAAALSVVLPVSAPVLTKAQAEVLIDRLKRQPPKLIVSDYDDTLVDNEDGLGSELPPQLVATIHELQARGHVRVAIATNRPWELSTADGRPVGMAQLVGEKLGAAQRKGLVLSTGGGAQTWKYGRRGSKPQSPVFEEDAFTQAEKEQLAKIVGEALEPSGLVQADVLIKTRPHEYVVEIDQKRKRIDRLGARVERGLRRAGLKWPMTVKWPESGRPPYIRIARVDKASAIKGILETLADEGLYLEPSDVLILGDDFDRPGFDKAMAEALPGATVLSFGSRADPGLDNVYLWPEAGAKAARKLLSSLASHLTDRRPEHRFSYTQLEVYRRSQAEYKKRYVEAGEGPGGKTPLPAYMGQKVHQAMHWLYSSIRDLDLSKPNDRRKLPKLDELLDNFDGLWDKSWDDDEIDVDADPFEGPLAKAADAKKGSKSRLDAYREHGRAYLREYYQRFYPFDQSKTFLMEKQLTFEIKGPARSYLFTGWPDRVSIAPDGALEIHDYKSGHTPTESQVKADIQLALYAIAIRQQFPGMRERKVRLVWHYTLTDFTLEPSEADLQAVQAQAAALAEEIYQKFYKPAPAAPADVKGSDDAEEDAAGAKPQDAPEKPAGPQARAPQPAVPEAFA